MLCTQAKQLKQHLYLIKKLKNFPLIWLWLHVFSVVYQAVEIPIAYDFLHAFSNPYEFFAKEYS